MTRSRGGDITGTIVAAALLGGVVFPVLGMWLGLGWWIFRWTAGWWTGHE